MLISRKGLKFVKKLKKQFERWWTNRIALNLESSGSERQTHKKNTQIHYYVVVILLSLVSRFTT